MPRMLARDKRSEGAPVRLLNSRIREYLALQAARRYGPIEPSLAPLVRRSIRRNFGVLLAPELVASQLAHYKAIYDTAAALLGKHLKSVPPGTYANPSHVRWDAFIAAIAKRHPREPRKLLGLVANFAIYYEYLR
jgi:hypothetical protein